MTVLARELRLVLLALQFLTRVPVPAWVGFDAALMRRAVRHFPLVGALVGAFGAGVLLAAGHLWPPAIAAALAVAATVWLTAAFHEDGLADTCDALLGAASREKALAIMKDSRIGTYGAAALGLVLLLRVLLAAALLSQGVWAAAAALVASHAAGRALAVTLMGTLPYAGEQAQAKTHALTRDASAADVAWAVASSALLLGGAVVLHPAPWLSGSIAAVLLLLIFTGMRTVLRRRLQGYTGDTLGAAEQLGEVAVLLAMAASLR